MEDGVWIKKLEESSIIHTGYVTAMKEVYYLRRSRTNLGSFFRDIPKT